MTGDAGAWSVEPVVNPGVREARARRLTRMTKEQIAGRTGPVRQIRYRDQVVSPLALELECRQLLQRAQRAITTIVTSKVYAGDLRGTVEEPVRDATTARILSLELLAAQVAAAEAARRDWETAHRMAANNDKYLDLVARTAADQRATVEITDLAGQAAEAAQAFRETLQRAALAAEALVLPEPR